MTEFGFYPVTPPAGTISWVLIRMDIGPYTLTRRDQHESIYATNSTSKLFGAAAAPSESMETDQAVSEMDEPFANQTTMTNTPLQRSKNGAHLPLLLRFSLQHDVFTFDADQIPQLDQCWYFSLGEA